MLLCLSLIPRSLINISPKVPVSIPKIILFFRGNKHFPPKKTVTYFLQIFFLRNYHLFPRNWINFYGVLAQIPRIVFYGFYGISIIFSGTLEISTALCCKIIFRIFCSLLMQNNVIINNCMRSPMSKEVVLCVYVFCNMSCTHIYICQVCFSPGSAIIWGYETLDSRWPGWWG